MRGTRYEYSTTGFDENFQLVGSDPFHGPYNVGMRIPVSPTGVRFLFLLAIASFNANQKARLVGLRQLVTIGQFISNGQTGLNQAFYPLELQVTSPQWHFTDGNISWHLMRVPPNSYPPGIGFEGYAFQYSRTPALLFQFGRPPVNYAPPYGGHPPGNILIPELGNWHDMRFPWRSDHAWDSLDVEIQGPCDIALFASVLQTQPTGPNARTPLILPAGVPLDILQPEDAFIAQEPTPIPGLVQQNGPAPNAVYWRIAGSLVFEMDNFYPIPQELDEPPIVSPIQCGLPTAGGWLPGLPGGGGRSPGGGGGDSGGRAPSGGGDSGGRASSGGGDSGGRASGGTLVPGGMTQ